MTDFEIKIHSEFQSIVEVVTTITGLSSHWNGSVELVASADFKGKKRFSCGIELHESLILKDERWSTMIHEVLHSVSVGYNSRDFQIYKGWEEGTVEQLQRLIRPQVLAKLAVSVPSATFEINDRYHAFNRFIDSLERLRTALNADEGEQMAFYIAILGVPMRERAGYVLNRARQTAGVLDTEFVKTFSAANAVLMGGAR